ncbi:DUF1496 domain-containing protein [Pseudoalteromonas piscicida]|uniref:DUF1496 domain-containing protein n=1 Tax=Pseudoalteromonas piscicida TaxID=43662 RepID=A0AAD0RHF5_PSEO7|nr:DUF1496 domain-containing protein [Pseudoalteromonas piscicida]ASD67594.1 hypothetical protein B1L02_11590 [Pseudoalteromonas piscicida]AXQ98570.1 DUF1496 domain-containing protein [Pseudoalteromonas piscicida]AXR01704.1 DUF1496 domain-containing protein [Pseudoalteromonas piscicida]
MIKYIFSVLLLAPVITIASEASTVEVNKKQAKTYDSTKFCYYADKEFSEGAKHYIGDVVQRCVRRDDNILVWKTL